MLLSWTLFFATFIFLKINLSFCCSQDRAVKLWMMKSFIDLYLNVDQGRKDQIEKGKVLYNMYKFASYKEEITTGAVFDTPIRSVIAQVDDWQKKGFMSPSEAEIQKIELSADQTQKVIKEYIADRGKKEMIFGMDAFIKLSETTGALVYTFLTFKLNVKGNLTYTKSNECKLWNTLCQVIYGIASAIAGNMILNGEQIENLMAYIRYRALTNFYQQNGNFLQQLKAEEQKCHAVLPNNAKKVQKMKVANKYVPITTVFSYDPFVKKLY